MWLHSQLRNHPETSTLCFYILLILPTYGEDSNHLEESGIVSDKTTTQFKILTQNKTQRKSEGYDKEEYHEEEEKPKKARWKFDRDKCEESSIMIKSFGCIP